MRKISHSSPVIMLNQVNVHLVIFLEENLMYDVTDAEEHVKSGKNYDAVSCSIFLLRN